MSDNFQNFDKRNAEDTVEHDRQGTRPTQNEQTSPIKIPAPPQGQHVQPLAGKKQQSSGYRRRPPRNRNKPNDSSLYLPWWSLVVMLSGVLIISFGLVAIVLFLGNPDSTSEPTPIIRIITAVPTQLGQAAPQPTANLPATQIIVGGSAPDNLALQGPTLPPVIFTSTPIPIAIGRFVLVDGVDADQLNVRDRAGINGTTILFRAEEGEQFNVIDGPAQGDGFTWWRIQDPNDLTRVGWAVANFLSVLPDQ